jgi:AraC family transcriptional regulator
MNKNTPQRHAKIANGVMYYIYTHIDTNIGVDELSREFNVSKFYMSKLFKGEFVRLQFPLLFHQSV